MILNSKPSDIGELAIKIAAVLAVAFYKKEDKYKHNSIKILKVCKDVSKQRGLYELNKDISNLLAEYKCNCETCFINQFYEICKFEDKNGNIKFRYNDFDIRFKE